MMEWLFAQKCDSCCFWCLLIRLDLKESSMCPSVVLIIGDADNCDGSGSMSEVRISAKC